jgi:predicted AAA+ superfamily ATPase
MNIILDKVQIMSGWMRAVNSFRVDFNVDIYITGSNASVGSLCRNKVTAKLKKPYGYLFIGGA